MDFIVIFDLMIGGFGIYLVYTAFRMKKTGEISNLVINKEEISKCKDPIGLIDFIYKKTAIFGVVACVFGVVGFINDTVFSMGSAVNTIGMLVFLGMWIWFTSMLRKARGQFFY